MNNKLKPCPFCGGRAIIDGCDDTLWIVICKECNGQVPLVAATAFNVLKREFEEEDWI